MKKLFIGFGAVLLYILTGTTTAQAATYDTTLSSQPDESYLCAPDWENCFTGGTPRAFVNLGSGASLQGGTIKSVTIARDETSQFANRPWVIEIYCFTDNNYTNACTDWIAPTLWNGNSPSTAAEFTSSTSADNKHWTADFTDPTHQMNADGSSPLRFRPEYFYQLVINDNLWDIGAYGSLSGKPYYVLTGSKTTLDPVIIIPGILGSWEKNGQWVIDPVLHTYDNLIDTLAANGYEKDKTLFTFPYDWRNSNIATAQLLKQKIDQVKTICNCSKIDLIGHSMGGLVAAQYIEGGTYGNDVDQLFLLATPLSGAPKAYKTWEAGEVDFGDGPQNIVMRTKFKNYAKEAGYGTIFEYIRGRPVSSVQELLPVNSDYLWNNITTRLHYPSGYPRNTFLENLDTNFGLIKSKGVTLRTVLADTNTDATIGGYIIASSTKPGLWPEGQPGATIFVEGDITVPRSSIESVTTVDKEFASTTHTEVVSNSSSYIYRELTGRDPGSIIVKTYNSLISFIYFQLFSPIDMVITAPDGKRLGKDFSANTEINEIPNAFYSGFIGDNEYAIILNPTTGTYKVDTVGTGAGGHYTIVADYTDLTTSSSIEIIGTSTPGDLAPYSFIVSPTSTTISLPPPPVATSTPTTTPITPDTCISSITKAYQDKWIGKKTVYEKLVFDCKALKELFKGRDVLEKIPAIKRKPAEKLLLAGTYTGIKLTLADMDLLAKDKSNTKDAVLLINNITLWFKKYELGQ